MGPAGYYPPGQGAGDGGPGGGAGAGGGASLSGNPGMDGNSGYLGGQGGAPGQGAAGGGIIYIKAGSYSISGTGATFHSSGGYGENGLPGENGGNGGIGGDGGQGSCNGSTAYGGGGHGGAGAPGTGSAGGDAGNGGSAGYLWIISQTSPNGVNASHVNVNGGAGGKGGPGGYSVSLYCNFESEMDLSNCSLDITKCPNPPPPCADEHTCNCDKAYEMLSFASTTAVAGTNVTYFDAAGDICATYTTLDGLTGVELKPCGTAYYYYHCPVFNPDNCDAIFVSLGNKSTYAGSFVMPTDVEFIPATNEYKVKDGSMNELIWYKSSWEYVTDLTVPTGPIKCYNGACTDELYYSTGYIINQGPPGADAEPTPDGSTTAGDTKSNFPNGTGTPGETGWKNGPNGLNDLTLNELGINLYPNPSSGKVTIELNAELNGTMKLKVLDITGKEVLSQEASVSVGANNLIIDLATLDAGYYLVHIVIGDKTSVLPLTKN